MKLVKGVLGALLISSMAFTYGCGSNSEVGTSTNAAVAVPKAQSYEVKVDKPQYINEVNGVWVAPSFTFHDGSVLKDVKFGYKTFGNPKGKAVLILHGTNGSGSGMLAPSFASNLFNSGQPLDASKYFIIMPDALGAGNSSKPSDGLKTKFPHYNYEDMVLGQYRLLTEGLNIKHLRLVLGNSMGGMQTWMWGINYPDFMDALMPLASLPQAMSGRNWMTRDLLVTMIKSDPEFNNGDYVKQPEMARIASAFFNTATNGGALHLYSLAPDGESGSKLVEELLSKPFTKDANDTIYQWSSSKDYDPSKKLSRIKAKLFAINSLDDERNPEVFGSLQKAMKQIKGAKYYLIPESEETSGHGTTMQSMFWASKLQELLDSAPHRSTKP